MWVLGTSINYNQKKAVNMGWLKEWLDVGSFGSSSLLYFGSGLDGMPTPHLQQAQFISDSSQSHNYTH